MKIVEMLISLDMKIPIAKKNIININFFEVGYKLM